MWHNRWPIRSRENRFLEKIDKTPGQGPRGDCWIWKGSRTKRGYGTFCWITGRTVTAHHAAWLIKHNIDEPLKRPLCIMHTCDHPPCVRDSHLKKGTLSDNMKDCSKKNRQIFQVHPERVCRGDAHWTRKYPERTRGENNTRAKLTAEKVLKIRKDYSTGTTLTILASQYCVSRSVISSVVNARSWKHVGGIIPSLKPHTRWPDKLR